MIVLESVEELTLKAILDGIFAFIIPVITSTDGLWVAMIRWIPAARAIWAIRVIAASTSFDATIIRSASSSMITTIYGSFWTFSESSLSRSRYWLYASMFLVPEWENKSYRRSISLTIRLSASLAFCGFVTTGDRRCGIPLRS